MNYDVLIQNRKSVREYGDRKVPVSAADEIKTWYKTDCQRLLPGLKTELHIFGSDVKAALEGAAGYEEFLSGSPCYLVLLSEEDDHAIENAGYMMEDLILKLTDMDLGSCWITFTDSDRVKKALGLGSPLQVAAIAAFGCGVRSARRLRFNFLSMGNVDSAAKRQYFAPKWSIYDMSFLNAWGNTDGLDDYIGFYDNMLWEALYAATLSPSYLNRQPYGFVLHDGNVTLVRRPDSYTDRIDGDLDMGVVLLHFSAVAAKWAGKIQWKLGADASDLSLPEGYSVVASCRL